MLAGMIEDFTILGRDVSSVLCKRPSFSFHIVPDRLNGPERRVGALRRRNPSADSEAGIPRERAQLASGARNPGAKR